MSSALWSVVGHGRVRWSTLDAWSVVRLVESSAGIPSTARGEKERTRVMKQVHHSRRQGRATSGGEAPSDALRPWCGVIP